MQKLLLYFAFNLTIITFHVHAMEPLKTLKKTVVFSEKTPVQHPSTYELTNRLIYEHWIHEHEEERCRKEYHQEIAHEHGDKYLRTKKQLQKNRNRAILATLYQNEIEITIRHSPTFEQNLAMLTMPQNNNNNNVLIHDENPEDDFGNRCMLYTIYFLAGSTMAAATAIFTYNFYHTKPF